MWTIALRASSEVAYVASRWAAERPLKLNSLVLSGFRADT